MVIAQDTGSAHSTISRNAPAGKLANCL